MKHYQNRTQKGLFRCTGARHRLTVYLVVLLTVVFPLTASAQFIRLNLFIPPKTDQTEFKPFQFTQNFNSGMEMLEGKGTLCISGVENFQVLASFTHSDSLRNEAGQAIPWMAKLSYRNDGQSQPPGKDAGHVVSFPLSDCGRMIEYIKGNPQVINAFLFLQVNTTLSKVTSSVYTGDICLIIEYN